MGGHGSGQWHRWSSKSTTESCHRIDIRYLRKQGFLNAGTVGSLSWSVAGEQSGSVGYRVYSERLELNYRYKAFDSDEWIPIQRFIWFEITPCHFGGQRYWFTCPDCSRRCEILYGIGHRFTCRKCADLAYGSQQERPIDRAYRRARKIRRQLTSELDPEFEPDNLTDPIIYKPKGMHWRTFERLYQKQQRHIENANRLLAFYFRNTLDLLIDNDSETFYMNE